jgi:hypothetical protein
MVPIRGFHTICQFADKNRLPKLGDAHSQIGTEALSFSVIKSLVLPNTQILSQLWG